MAGTGRLLAIKAEALLLVVVGDQLVGLGHRPQPDPREAEHVPQPYL